MVVVFDAENYVNAAEQPKNIREEVPNNYAHLFKAINAVLAKIRKRGDLRREILDYIMIKDLKFAKFYLLTKIHRGLHYVPAGSALPNSAFFADNISCLLDYYLKPLALAVKPHVKNTNAFFKKLHSLPELPEGTILRTMDVVVLYLNIQHDESMSALKRV